MPGKSQGVAVATYHTYDSAVQAVGKLNGIKLMNTELTASWKDPNFDIINELSYETRVLLVKNISYKTTVP
jgi:RNA recognition motif. (a.k.a. RRM, RBD, or RNP domain)